MKKLFLIPALFFLVLSTSAKALPPPPYEVYYRIVAILIQQVENTNIVLNSTTDKILKLRIKKDYEIFDKSGKVVLRGSGKEIDVSSLSPGKYTIKFDKDYNQIEYFTKK